MRRFIGMLALCGTLGLGGTAMAQTPGTVYVQTPSQCLVAPAPVPTLAVPAPVVVAPPVVRVYPYVRYSHWYHYHPAHFHYHYSRCW